MLNADRLLPIVWERKWLALATFVVTLAAAAAVTFSLPKVYETTTYLYVSSGQQELNDFESVQANEVRLKTLAELLQTRNVAQLTADRLPYGSSAVDLLGQVEVTAVQQSQLITLTVSASSPERAQRTANTYAGTFIAFQRELLKITAGASQVSLAASAPLIDDPSRPKPRLYLLVGAFVALLAAFGAAILRDRTDTRLRLDSSATELEGVPVIGRIPRVPSAGLSAAADRATRPASARQLDEAYRLVLANLTFANNGARPKTLAITSSGRSEGKSTSCLSLALGAAELGVDVLVVDGDMRRPRIGTLIGAPIEDRAVGLSTLLDADHAPLHTAVDHTSDAHLLVLRTGPLPPNPAGLLAGPRLPAILEEAAGSYDLTIIDTPPLTVGADASLIASVTSGTVLVIDSRSTSRTDVNRAIDQLRRARANLLGVVLNQVDDMQDSNYYAPLEKSGRKRRREGTEAGSLTQTTS